MTKVTTLPIPQTIKSPAVSLVNADGTTAKTFYTAGAEGSLLKMFHLTSTDTVARVQSIILNNGSTDFYMGSVSVPAGAGTDGTNAAVDVLNSTGCPGLPLDANGKRFWQLQANYVVKIKPAVATTAAKTIDATGSAEEY